MTTAPAADVRRGVLRVRWLGRVPYREALALQEGLFRHGRDNHLFLLEHPHVFTHGPRSDLATNIKVEPASVGAELVPVKRGGDVTYHGPGQLVGYPIVNVDNAIGAADHVCAVQSVLVRSLRELGLRDVGCLDEYPGVWVEPDGPNPRKIAAIGVRLARGRTMHGFALNVATDMRFETSPFVSFAIAVASRLTVAASPALATVPPSTSALSTELTVTFWPGASAWIECRRRDRSCSTRTGALISTRSSASTA